MEEGHSVLFAPAYRLAQDLPTAKRDLELPRRLRKLDNFDFLLLDDLGYLRQGNEESEVLFTLIAERYERRSPGITSNLVFWEWERTFAKPMATAAAIDRVAHNGVTLKFSVPRDPNHAAQQRGEATGVNRQECLTRDNKGENMAVMQRVVNYRMTAGQLLKGARKARLNSPIQAVQGTAR